MQKYWQKKNSNALYALLYAVRDKYRQLFLKIDIEEAKWENASFFISDMMDTDWVIYNWC